MLSRIPHKILAFLYLLISYCRAVKIRFIVRWIGRGEIQFRHCRFNVPLRVYGSKGKVTIGDGTFLGYHAAPRYGSGEIMLQAREKNAEIMIGEKCSFSNNVSIVARKSVSIGTELLCGEMVFITDSDFHGVLPESRLSPGETIPVKIGNNVWLGSRVMVLKGVKIGDNSVIAAGSIVTSDIPARSVAAGIPARIIRKL